MAGYLEGRTVFVVGGGTEGQRAVAVALAEAGANVAVGGAAGDLASEVALHSIANEIWALGRRSTVVTIESSDAPGLAAAVARAGEELGRADLVVRCDAILEA